MVSISRGVDDRGSAKTLEIQVECAVRIFLVKANKGAVDLTWISNSLHENKPSNHRLSSSKVFA